MLLLKKVIKLKNKTLNCFAFSNTFNILMKGIDKLLDRLHEDDENYFKNNFFVKYDIDENKYFYYISFKKGFYHNFLFIPFVDKVCIDYIKNREITEKEFWKEYFNRKVLYESNELIWIDGVISYRGGE